MNRLIILGLSTILACGGKQTPPDAVDLRGSMLEVLNRDGPAIALVDAHEASGMRVEKYLLANGLTVLYLHDDQAPVVSYQTWFRVGSRHEVDKKTGIAHLFEHLMFKETSNTPEGEFDRRLEGIGGRINAATWLDWTYYYADVPAAHFEEVVQLEADRMQHVILNTTQLEAERKVVINERKERIENDPGGKLSELLWNMAYTTHPYGHPTLGWMPDIEGLSLEDCLEFYGTYYSPNNAVVLVVGDVPREAALQIIIKHYGAMQAQEIPAAAAVTEPAQTEARRLEVKLPLSAERLMVGFHAPAATDPSHPALEILNEILAEGDSARLQRALVTDGEVATAFYAFVPAFREPGLYEFGIDLRPGQPAEVAEEILLKTLAAVREHGVTAAELVKAKNKLETQFYRQLQTTQQRASALGYWEITASYERLFTLGETYQAVTEADVLAVARTVFAPESRSVVIGRRQP